MNDSEGLVPCEDENEGSSDDENKPLKDDDEDKKEEEEGDEGWRMPKTPEGLLERMKEISELIKEGAHEFLMQEYLFLAGFLLVFAVIIFVSAVVVICSLPLSRSSATSTRRVLS